MKCCICHRNIRPGLEAAKRVEFWLQPGGEIKMFSDSVSDADGKLAAATGRLDSAAHAKCYWANRKRAERAADAAQHEGNRAD